MKLPELFPASLAGFLVAFLVAVLAGPAVIHWLRVLKFGQNINEHAPESHKQKQGTPSMGGVLLLLALLVALVLGLLFAPGLRPLSGGLIAVVLVFAAHAGLGFTDDFLKARRGKSLGLLARQKLAGQVVIGLAFVIWLALTGSPESTTQVFFWGTHYIDLGFAYYPLALLLMIGMSNAANLADGLDGLAGGLSIFTLLGLGLTTHLNWPQLPPLAFTLAGACLGFLWYNAHPAKVFMGDTGSLALGSSFAALAILGKQEVLLLLFAIVFLMEVGSVSLQVPYFKITGGKRIFRSTPIHHHFELLGWKETQVVARFWILGILALVLGLWLAPMMYVWLR